MPFSRFAKMPGEKRERLMTVAAQEFAAHGFEAASFNRILEEAQIGKSSAYYYFEDKADLFCTVVQYCMDRLQLAPTAEDVAALTAENFWSEVAKIHDQPLLYTLQQPWLFGVVRAAERLTPESLQRESLARLASYLTDYIMTNMGAVIKRGQELAMIRSDLPIDLLIAWFRAVDGASDDWLLAHLEQLEQEAITRVSQQTITTIQQMLAPLI
ncbi:MAG TPA: TetR/AcrR family transcriptional regulator [Ktedonobacteraceae bacterium]|nr:TetR/AcrR family transcriptional regulator [Ktedonobacteraceae bacterium]